MCSADIGSGATKLQVATTPEDTVSGVQPAVPSKFVFGYCLTLRGTHQHVLEYSGAMCSVAHRVLAYFSTLRGEVASDLQHDDSMLGSIEQCVGA